MKKLATKSATKYLNDTKDEKDCKEYPEMKDEKGINYYTFDTVTESYLRDGKQIEYKRTARKDKNDMVCDIVENLTDSGDKYLKHRAYVDNVSKI